MFHVDEVIPTTVTITKQTHRDDAMGKLLLHELFFHEDPDMGVSEKDHYASKRKH